jgi:hypothetical protein
VVLGWVFVVAYAALLAAVSIATVTGDDVETGSRAAERFVQAWERNRSATYVLEATFVRRSGSTDSQLPAAVVVAQRPPMRVVHQFGGILGQIRDKPLVCGARPTGKPTCYLGTAGRSFAESVAYEVKVLRTYFTGRSPVYTVLADGSCFSLRRQYFQPVAPYGAVARLCFDRATGAARFFRVAYDNGVTETTTARTIRTTVTDADLRY